MTDFITTYTGMHFNPIRPEEEKIFIQDIAHALSLLCRGNGHVSCFFSVGQHCIHCAKEAEARGYSARVCLACLLHDAGEAYMSDVTSPLKQHLPEYREYENKLLEIIYQKYLGDPLTPAERSQVDTIDHEMLYYDLKELLGEEQERTAPEMKTSFSYAMRPFDDVEEEYKALFARYTQQLPHKAG